MPKIAFSICPFIIKYVAIRMIYYELNCNINTEPILAPQREKTLGASSKILGKTSGCSNTGVDLEQLIIH